MRLFNWDAGDGRMLKRGETDRLKYGKEAAAGPNQISLDWRGGGGAGLVIRSGFSGTYPHRVRFTQYIQLVMMEGWKNRASTRLQALQERAHGGNREATETVLPFPEDRQTHGHQARSPLKTSSFRIVAVSYKPR